MPDTTRAEAPFFAPDCGWVAYVSDETGRGEVYIRPFPFGSPTIRVSDDGGGDPVWSRAGNAVLFRSISGLDVMQASR